MAGEQKVDCPFNNIFESCRGKKLFGAEYCDKCIIQVASIMANKKRVDYKCARYPVCRAVVANKLACCSASCSTRLRQDVVKGLLASKKES